MQFFETIAPFYGDDWTIEEENRVLVRSLVPDGVRILEVGCGNGRILCNLPRVRRVGVDFSWKMICEARRRVPDAAFVVGEATRLPFRTGSFDVVLAVNSVHNHADAMPWFRELARLRPRRLLVDFRNARNPIVQRTARRFRAAMASAGVFYYVYGRSEMKNMLSQVGFSVRKRLRALRPWSDPRQGFRWRHLIGWAISLIPGLAPTYVIEAVPHA